MDLRQILLLIVTGLYFWFCHWFICCKTYAACYGCGETRVTEMIAPPVEEEQKVMEEQKIAPPPTARPQGPLLFNWESDRPVTSSKFPSFQESILKSKTAKNILVITGKYFEEETKPADYDNMGLARANQIKELFLGDVPEDRIQLRARLVVERAGVEDDLFKSANFNWIAPIPEEYGDTEDVARVEELDDRALIYFPFNSAQKEMDSKVNDYLAKVAETAKSNEAKIELTGHTDNKGKERANLRLGKLRAEKIKKLLVAKGVDANQIEIISKGQSEPTVPNTTEANRRLNRRVEVKILN